MLQRQPPRTRAGKEACSCLNPWLISPQKASSHLPPKHGNPQGMTKRAHLEAQADAILKLDAEALERLGASAEALREAYAELLHPNNDPVYLAKLERTEAMRNYIANQIAKIHLVPQNGKNWLSLEMVNPKNHALAMDLLRSLGLHFEASAHRHEDPKDLTRTPVKAQEPQRRHTFGRTKRSLGDAD